MFRSDEEAASQRADALHRELDAAHIENEHLQRQLANANARLITGQHLEALELQATQLSEQLASTLALLQASENERRRLESLVPVRRRLMKVEHNNPGTAAHPSVSSMLVLVVAFSLLFAIAVSR